MTDRPGFLASELRGPERDPATARIRVIPVPLERRAAMTFRDVPLEGVLRGWAIVGRLDYRAHRLPSGGPIHIEVSAQGEPLGEVEIHNFGPLEPFEIPLPGKGRGAVRFEIWTADGRDRPFGLAADVRRPPEADR